MSYLPVVAGITIVLIFGSFAELQTRALTHQAERARVASDLEAVRAELELTVGAQFEVLSKVSGAIASVPSIQAPRFTSVVTSVVPELSPIRGIAAMPRLTGEPLLTGAFRHSEQLSTWITETVAETPGARTMVQSGRPGLLIWIPVYVGESMATRRNWGFTAALIDTEALFDAAGLRSQSSDLSIALTTGDSASPGRFRALQLGHSSILSSDPVTIDVAISGGDWSLSAIPRAGWSQNSGAIWPIRILTVLSILLVAVPMIRTRALISDRQRYISVLHEREKQLAETSRRLRMAFDATQLGVWDYEVRTGKLFWDARMFDLYGMPEGAEPTLESWWTRIHPDDAARVQEEFQSCIASGDRFESGYRILLDDGSERHIRAIGIPGTNTGSALHIVGANWDVTEDELRNALLEERKREAEEASAAKSRFVAMISHEIRTPMNGVTGILDLMLRDELSEPQRERSIIVRDSARHLLAIVNDLLDLTKLRSERVEIHPEPTNVGRIAQDIISLMSSIGADKDVDLITSNSGHLPQSVICDPLRLRQVIMNLVGNAVKYTDEGQIHLSLTYDRAEQMLIVSVKDTGIGIPPETIDHLFERYAQVDSREAQRRGGTGLGLAICRELVTLMGGSISVESVPGQGSTFRFQIPAPPAPTDLIEVDATASALPGSDTPATATRVLVAEDNSVNQRVLSGYLEIGGHDVTMVSNGLDAIASAQTGQFDIILMDVEMPVIDGVTATRRIRALDGPVADIPIIALTANSGPEDVATYFEAGMTAHVLKPFTVDTLFGAMETALANAKSNAAKPDLTATDTPPARAAVSGRA